MKVLLDNLLEKRGKTRYWLAQKINVKHQTITKLANNDTVSIKFDLLEKICIALECEIGDVLKLERKKEEA